MTSSGKSFYYCTICGIAGLAPSQPMKAVSVWKLMAVSMMVGVENNEDRKDDFMPFFLTHVICLQVCSTLPGIRALDAIIVPATVSPISTCVDGITTTIPAVEQTGCLDTCFSRNFGGLASGTSGWRQCCPADMCPQDPISPSMIATCHPCK